jgi:hypothetical protein
MCIPVRSSPLSEATSGVHVFNTGSHFTAQFVQYGGAIVSALSVKPDALRGDRVITSGVTQRMTVLPTGICNDDALMQVDPLLDDDDDDDIACGHVCPDFSSLLQAPVATPKAKAKAKATTATTEHEPLPLADESGDWLADALAEFLESNDADGDLVLAHDKSFDNLVAQLLTDEADAGCR